MTRLQRTRQLRRRLLRKPRCAPLLLREREREATDPAIFALALPLQLQTKAADDTRRAQRAAFFEKDKQDKAAAARLAVVDAETRSAAQCLMHTPAAAKVDAAAAHITVKSQATKEAEVRATAADRERKVTDAAVCALLLSAAAVASTGFG